MSEERLVDRIDGYSPQDMPPPPDVDKDPSVLEALAKMDAVHMDDFINKLTGIGTISHDKVLGGEPGGVLPFRLRMITGSQARDRWRGSDLGSSIIEKVPGEMTRAGFETTVQLTDDDKFEEKVDSRSRARIDSVARELRRRRDEARRRKPRSRLDANETAKGANTAGPIGRNDQGQAIVQMLDARHLALGTDDKMCEGLKYERAYGGGVVLMGIDDGRPLSAPVDEKNIRTVSHLTALRGGWDGEAIAWDWYRDQTGPRYGDVAVYMIRNIGVPIARIPVPGEDPRFIDPDDARSGNTIDWVHESRLLVFPGQAADHYARVQMRGWGDSTFTRIDEVLSQFSQTWGGISNALTGFAQDVLTMDGLANLIGNNDPKGQNALLQRMLLMQLQQSIARAKVVDTNEKLERLQTTFSGIAPVLQEFTRRFCAAADMPESLLFGSGKSGLRSGDDDTRFFYDRVKSAVTNRVLPPRRRLTRYMLLAKDGPTGGVEPKEWTTSARSLWQPTDEEEAKMRLTVAQMDHIYITDQVYSPEVAAMSSFSGSKYTMERTVDPDDYSAGQPSDDETELNPDPNAPAKLGPDGKPIASDTPAPEDEALTLTPSAVASIITVNEARAKYGYPPAATDGDLTITEYQAKRAQVVAEVANAEAGSVRKPPEADKPAPAPFGGAKPGGTDTGPPQKPDLNSKKVKISIEKPKADVAPPGREEQVEALEKAPNVENPYAVAWASYEDSETEYEGAECNGCLAVPPFGTDSAGIMRIASHANESGALCDGGGDRIKRADIIKKRGGKWVLLSKKTGKVLGTHPSKAEAEQQERAIQASKHA